MEGEGPLMEEDGSKKFECSVSRALKPPEGARGFSRKNLQPSGKLCPTRESYGKVSSGVGQRQCQRLGSTRSLRA